METESIGSATSFTAIRQLKMDLTEHDFALATRLQYSALSPQNYQELPPPQKFGLAYATFLMGMTNPSTREHYKGIINHYIQFLVNIHESQRIRVDSHNIGNLFLKSQGAHISMWRHDLLQTGGVAGTVSLCEWKILSKYTPNSKTSVENKTSALSSFFNFLAKPCMDGTKALLDRSPIDALQSRFQVGRYVNAKKIDISAFKSMLRACNTNTLRGLRDYTLLFGYFLTGRRNREWLRVRWGNINWNTNPPTYSFVFKGQKMASDEIPAPLLQVMNVYLTKRWGNNYQESLAPGVYLFAATHKMAENKPISERQMLNVVKNLAKKAGLDPDKIEVHSLRHLNAEEYLAAGASVEDIRGRLRHQSLGTTQRYVSSMNDEGNPLADVLDKLLHEE